MYQHACMVRNQQTIWRRAANHWAGDLSTLSRNASWSQSFSCSPSISNASRCRSPKYRYTSIEIDRMSIPLMHQNKILPWCLVAIQVPQRLPIHYFSILPTTQPFVPIIQGSIMFLGENIHLSTIVLMLLRTATVGMRTKNMFYLSCLWETRTGGWAAW
jgi:hypothetical protein